MTRIINAGLPRSKKGSHKTPSRPTFVPMPLTQAQVPIRAGATTSHIPSAGSGVGNALVKKVVTPYDDPELAAREAAAQLAASKRTIAPICNKGAYQLITDQQDIKTMGRKT